MSEQLPSTPAKQDGTIVMKLRNITPLLCKTTLLLPSRSTNTLLCSKTLLLFFSTVLLLVASSVRAHDARPLSIIMTEQSAGLYRVVVRAPPTLPVADAPALLWPPQCEVLESAPLVLSFGSTSMVRCMGGISGSQLELRYPSFNPSLTTLVRLDTLDGHAITEVLPPQVTQWRVATQPDFLQIASQYTVLGFQHILEGLDHLLFVAGLLMLARNMRKLILAVTGFTLAHSLTLALATFELVRLPIDLVEALIALSVVFLAAEVLRNNPDSFSQRYPVLLSFVFGLLHGFGFASVLSEISLPPSAIAQGLLFFNLGVELGQLAFIAVCLMLWRLYLAVAPRPLHALHTGSWLIGMPAAYWFVERAIPLLSV
jgi:hydrogenase/urease accessory protein HupE